MVVIGERAVERLHRRAAAELRSAFPGDQQAPARAGLATYTPEEIRRQIAQAEIDAYFRNDPDAALAASKRLGASFVLRGLITSQARHESDDERQPGVGQHGLHADRRQRPDDLRVDAHSSSYAGADVSRMALTLVNEKADEVVAKLYADYCPKAGLGSWHGSPQRSEHAISIATRLESDRRNLP